MTFFSWQDAKEYCSKKEIPVNKIKPGIENCCLYYEVNEERSEACGKNEH